MWLCFSSTIECNKIKLWQINLEEQNRLTPIPPYNSREDALPRQVTISELHARIADTGEGKMVKRVCFGSDCFRPSAGISGVIGSVAFDTAALTAGGDGTRS